MIRTAITAATVLAALVLPTHTAAAAEIHDVPMARAADPLTIGEAKQITKYLLRNLLGPAVSSAPELSMIAAWDCRTNGDTRGTCRGAVTGGVVSCRGIFRVIKYPKGYAVFPLRMECAAGK